MTSLQIILRNIILMYESPIKTGVFFSDRLSICAYTTPEPLIGFPWKAITQNFLKSCSAILKALYENPYRLLLLTRTQICTKTITGAKTISEKKILYKTNTFIFKYIYSIIIIVFQIIDRENTVCFPEPVYRIINNAPAKITISLCAKQNIIL